ncbi:uncharacterized protein LOC121375235 [Gigantopelta aegis]|uniref:uncharacterized protein LOC121375235 n=1 Tax=Gigantopelta aegis TaxID=1735272 RepID=UPI001B88741B|nr:uncharacterized protein LOC121375235 [Gigantopelta aegis]
MKSVSVHSHPQIEDPDAVRLLSTPRTRVRNELLPVQEIYNEEVSMLTDEQAAIVPSFSSLDFGLYRHRRKMLPKLPISRSEVDLRDYWVETKNNKRFLAINDGDDDKLLVFTTDEMLVRMQDAETLFVDGTFYTCPGLWDQLYSIHCLSGATMVPVAFALMPNRTRATYVRLFNQLSSVVEEKTGFDLSPEVVLTDFEIVAIQAIEEIFPDADTRGCLFHFNQCMLQKVQGLGLMRLYRADQGVQTLVRRLPLLPIDHVQDVWIDIMNERPDHLPHVTEFTDYVTTTWVDDDSLFKVAMWTQHGNIGPRTNNHLEGWHSKLNRSLT